MKSKTIPKPQCQSGYPDNQLREILGDKYKEFIKWMEGQTMCICDGREYDHDLEEYRNTGCGPHGPVVYTYDLKGFLNGRKIWD